MNLPDPTNPTTSPYPEQPPQSPTAVEQPLMTQPSILLSPELVTTSPASIVVSEPYTTVKQPVSSNTQTQRRSKKPWIIVGSIVAVLAVLGVVIYSSVAAGTKTQAALAVQFIENIQANDSQKAYNLLSPKIRQNRPLAQFSKSVSHDASLLPKTQPKVTYREITKASNGDVTTVIQARLAGDSNNSAGAIGAITFAKSGDQWYVISFKFGNPS